MIRAVFFDFYSVWTPDKMFYYLGLGQLKGPETFKTLSETLEQYYEGDIDATKLADTFRYKLGRPEITADIFKLNANNIPSEIVNFMRNVHGHFVKVGILANLGVQENELLQHFNEENKLFEIIASPVSLNLKKPLLSQEVFSGALQGIGEPPESCLVVSGNPYYLQFAASLGINYLQFSGFSSLEEDINNMISSST